MSLGHSLGIVMVCCRLAIAGVVATVAAGSAGAQPADWVDNPDGDGGTSEFYRRTGDPASPPGTLIAMEDLTGNLPSEAGRGIRILYVATDGVKSGASVVVSGQVLLPKSPMPAGGWPIVAWEHGTTGVADVCAPSWRGYLRRDRAYLDRWLDEGFAIVATDYQGLGTPGPHPYLLYRPEGYSVLDGLRAVQSHFDGTLRNQIILVGQSQGSGAALGTAWLAPRYAPSLNVLGVVATGLVVDFVVKPGTPHPPIPVSYSDPSQFGAAYGMLMVEGTDHSLHPGFSTRSVMTAEGIKMSHVARTACLGDLFKTAKADGVSGKDLFNGSLAPLEAGEVDASRIPDGAISVPVFAGTGLADYEASLPGQYNAVAAMCDAGTKVAWHLYPGLTHNGAVNGSLVDSIPFAKALLNGSPVGDTCGSIEKPGPVQPPTPGVPFNN